MADPPHSITCNITFTRLQLDLLHSIPRFQGGRALAEGGSGELVVETRATNSPFDEIGRAPHHHKLSGTHPADEVDTCKIQFHDKDPILLVLDMYA